jgi:ferredoxin-NADP reductase
MRHEADGIVSLTLEATGSDELTAWAPGAHIDITVGDGTTRQYSLCGSPSADHYQVAVLREEVGRGGSEYIHGALRVGHVVELGGPRNHFALEPAPEYVFVAGGIGITPLMPMIAELALTATPWHLYYYGRSRTTMAFLRELGEYGDSVTVIAKDEGTIVPAADVVAAANPGSLAYVCGPIRLIDDVRVGASSAGLEVRAELFAAPEAADDAAPAEGFTVRLTQSDLELVVPPDRSILDVVLEAGIDVLHDCAEGICGSCETAVTAGVPEHRDYVLTDREKADNNCMMICVSRTSCPVLELSL